MIPRHVVKPKQKLFRTLPDIRELPAHGQMILADCVATRLRPIKSDPGVVRLVIVNRIPIVTFLLVPPGRWSVMMSSPHQVMKAKRRHVIHDRIVRREHQLHDLVAAWASCVSAILVHSFAICSDESRGFQARRPKAYQFACNRWCPVQLRSEPVFATPAMPLRRCRYNVPFTTLLTVDPRPFAYVSESRNSRHIEARKTK